MKNLKIIIPIFFILFLSSCAITQEELWGSKSYNDSFKKFFIDKQNNRVVLIGENSKAFDGKENYHYALDDKVYDIIKMYQYDEDYKYVWPNLNCPDALGNVRKVFELGIKTGDMKISFDYPQATGSQIIVREMGIIFDKTKLSKDDIQFLYKQNFQNAQSGNNVFQYCPIKIVRYPASKEIAKNYNLHNLDFKKDGQIWEKNTPLQTAGKILLTPFAIAADILMAPFYLIGIIGSGVGGR
jgi:hypothetical protein